MKKHLLKISLMIVIGIVSQNLSYSQPSGYVYVNPEPIEAMVVPYIDTIIIDGIAEAAYPQSFSLSNILTYTAGEFTGLSDHSVKVQMGWRNEGIYMFFDIKDDIDKGSVLEWGLDGIELKINPDKANDGEYFEWKDDAMEIGIVRDITDEFRYHIVDIDGEGTEGNGPGVNGDTVEIGPRAGLPGLSFQIVNNAGSYTAEILIPWMFFLPLGTTEADIPVWRAKIMGFDIHCPDNDMNETNGGRDHSLIWDMDGDPTGTDADKANKNTSLLGNITFGERPNDIVVQKNNPLKIYPNPANKIVTIDNLADVTSVEIINAIGQVMQSMRPVGPNIKVDVSIMEKGIYFIKSKNRTGKTYINKLIVE